MGVVSVKRMFLTILSRDFGRGFYDLTRVD